TTNKCPVGTYRGVGRPSACFSMERMMDEVARELGMDPVELRLRNVVREFPYRTPTGLVYDSGSYAESLEKMRGLLGERPLGGGSTAIAASRIREKLLQIAAHNLEIEPDQLEVADGQVHVRGVPARGFPIATLARWALQEPRYLPGGMAPGLQETAFVDGVERGVFSNSCHAAVVRVDRELGTVQVIRYLVIEDCGRVINPMIVEGQVQGGTAQGIGGALLEELVY